MTENALKVIGNSGHPLSFSPDGSLLAVGGSSPPPPDIKAWVPIHVYSVDSGSEVQQIVEWNGRKYSPGGLLTFSPVREDLCTFLFLPSPTVLTGEIYIFNVHHPDVDVKEIKSPLGGKDHPLELCYSPDGGTLLYSAYESGNVMSEKSKMFFAINVETGKLDKTFSGHYHWVESLAFTPNGKIIASGSRDKSIMTWDFETGEKLREIRCGYDIGSLCFSHDGKKLASSGDVGADVWETQSGEKIHCLTAKRVKTRGHTEEVTQISFSKDDKLIATGSWDKTVKVWDPDTGEELKTINLPNWVYSTVFSPDGKYLVAGAHRVYLWDYHALL